MGERSNSCEKCQLSKPILVLLSNAFTKSYDNMATSRCAILTTFPGWSLRVTMPPASIPPSMDTTGSRSCRNMISPGSCSAWRGISVSGGSTRHATSCFSTRTRGSRWPDSLGADLAGTDGGRAKPCRLRRTQKPQFIVEYTNKTAYFGKCAYIRGPLGSVGATSGTLKSCLIRNILNKLEYLPP
jgi:hypothetical protein